MPPTPSIGRIARERTMIPMPPSHWVRERQSSRLGGSASISVRIVEPVVVKPLIVSKKALMYDGTAPVITKGKAPNRANSVQPKVTTAKPSRTDRSVSDLNWL